MLCTLFGQLWDVDNLESANDHHNIVLNYLGFIIQRSALALISPYFSSLCGSICKSQFLLMFISSNVNGVVNYRFTINVGPVSRIVISNKPNDVNFSKVILFYVFYV